MLVRFSSAVVTAPLTCCDVIGGCVIFGMLDREVIFGVFCPAELWRKSERFIRRVRRSSGVSSFFDRFEALVVLHKKETRSQDAAEAHRPG